MLHGVHSGGSLGGGEAAIMSRINAWSPSRPTRPDLFVSLYILKSTDVDWGYGILGIRGSAKDDLCQNLNIKFAP